MFGAFQPWHLLVLIVVAAALFGYQRLPEVAKSVGAALRAFKTEVKAVTPSSDDTATSGRRDSDR